MLSTILAAHTHQMHPVVPFHKNFDRVVQFDLSDANTSLTDEVFTSTDTFQAYIDAMLADKQARYGIGGYFENRKVYARSKVFDANKAHEEARSLHLGVDIWGAVNTPVMAPLDGTVHSMGYHPEFGNYGAVIILEHQLERHIFYTLYGHLAKANLQIQIGATIKGGEVFAQFGPPPENGYWPPHLHFQVMESMQGMEGDYPGVCAPSKADFYRANCPDPELILNWQ